MSTHDDQKILDAVGDWPGVATATGDRGELSIRLGRREIGHLHGDRAAHFGFPQKIGEQLRAEGRIDPHPVFPDRAAWGARALATDEDVADVIALLRLNYDRAVAKHGVPKIPTG